MRHTKVSPDRHTYQRVIPKLAQAGEINLVQRDFFEYLAMGKEVQFDAAIFLSAGRLASSNVDFSKKLADTTLQVIPKLKVGDLVWALQTLGHCVRAEAQLGFTVLERMRTASVTPDAHFWNQLLAACVAECQKGSQESRGLLERAFEESGLTAVSQEKPGSNLYAARQTGLNTYLQGLLALGLLKDAWGFLSQMLSPDLHSFTLMIGAFAKRGNVRGADAVFNSMKERNIWPDSQAITSLCLAYVKSPKLSDVPRAFDLFDQYFKTGKLRPDAVALGVQLAGVVRIMLETQPSDLLRDIGLHHSSIIERLSLPGLNNNNSDEAMLIRWRLGLIDAQRVLMKGPILALRELESAVKARQTVDLQRFKSLILACTQAGWREGVAQVYDILMTHETLQPDIFTINALISAHGAFGDYSAALELYQAITSVPEQRLTPNEFTFVTLIQALGRNYRVEEAEWAFKEAQRFLKDDRSLNLTAAMMDAFIKGDKVNEALTLFESIKTRSPGSVLTNRVLCNTFLNGCSRLGLVGRAEDFLREMLRFGLQPDDSSLSSILSCHRVAFECGIPGYLKVDILIEKLSKFVEPSGDYLMLSQLCDLARVQEDWILYEQLERTRVKKFGVRHGCAIASFWAVDGHSGVEVANGEEEKAHFFHPINELDSLLTDLKRNNGYRADLGAVPAPFSARPEEQRRRDLETHAEKKALAYLLTKTNVNAEIFIKVHNLRMCQDCHDFFTLCSNKFSRKLLCQDSTTLHIFEPGIGCKCSSTRWQPKPRLNAALILK